MPSDTDFHIFPAQPFPCKLDSLLVLAMVISIVAAFIVTPFAKTWAMIILFPAAVVATILLHRAMQSIDGRLNATAPTEPTVQGVGEFEIALGKDYKYWHLHDLKNPGDKVEGQLPDKTKFTAVCLAPNLVQLNFFGNQAKAYHYKESLELVYHKPSNQALIVVDEQGVESLTEP